MSGIGSAVNNGSGVSVYDTNGSYIGSVNGALSGYTQETVTVRNGNSYSTYRLTNGGLSYDFSTVGSSPDVFPGGNNVDSIRNIIREERRKDESKKSDSISVDLLRNMLREEKRDEENKQAIKENTQILNRIIGNKWPHIMAGIILIAIADLILWGLSCYKYFDIDILAVVISIELFILIGAPLTLRCYLKEILSFCRTMSYLFQGLMIILRPVWSFVKWVFKSLFGVCPSMKNIIRGIRKKMSGRKPVSDFSRPTPD